MADNKKLPGYLTEEADQDLYKRFIAIHDKNVLTEDQKQRVSDLKYKTLDLAREIASHCPNGRWRALALTELEATLDWALKSIWMED